MKSPLNDKMPLQGMNAYDQLRHEILRGTLMPGQRLSAAELNSRYDLGLTPIREALMKLSSEGLVDTKSHRGAHVRQASLTEFQDMMRCRREIEAICLRQAIDGGNDDWEGEILKSFHLLSRAQLPSSDSDIAALANWEQSHRRFHFSLVAAADSPWMLKFWNTLVDHTERYRKVRLLLRHEAKAEVRDVVSEHKAIMEAVIARDVLLAETLMNSHLSQTESAIVALLKMNADKEGIEA